MSQKITDSTVARIAGNRPMKGRELWRIKCWFGCRGNCPACQVSLNHALWRKFCHCGAPATGYRAMGADIDVEFFCDDHFQDLPAVEPTPEFDAVGLS